MYPEFIAIYVMLAIVIVMLGAALVFLFLLLKKGNSMGNSHGSVQQNNGGYYGQQYQQQFQASYQPQYQQQGGCVVFCKNCAAQFDSSQAYCPQCGARR